MEYYTQITVEKYNSLFLTAVHPNQTSSTHHIISHILIIPSCSSTPPIRPKAVSPPQALLAASALLLLLGPSSSNVNFSIFNLQPGRVSWEITTTTHRHTNITRTKHEPHSHQIHHTPLPIISNPRARPRAKRTKKPKNRVLKKKHYRILPRSSSHTPSFTPPIRDNQ